MNLRFIERDGQKILQYSIAKNPGDNLKYDFYDIVWVDVPLHQEPKKPREFWITVVDGKMSVSDGRKQFVEYKGAIPTHIEQIHVREVIE